MGAAVDLPKPEDRLPDRILSETEVQKLIDAASTERDRALLQLLYNAGLRVSEASALRWRHLQPHKAAGVLTTHGKGSKTRSVLLSAETWTAVMALRERRSSDDEPVFRSQKGGGISASQIYRIVKEATMQASIDKGVSPH